MERFKCLEKDLDPAALIKQARRFGPERFAAGIRAQLDALPAAQSTVG
jgi:hypothetical protein